MDQRLTVTFEILKFLLGPSPRGQAAAERPVPGP